MVMTDDNFFVSDDPIEIVSYNGKRYLKKEPAIEEISKNMLSNHLKDLMKNKPKQFGIGEFQIRYCSTCAQEYILHKRQTFCPVCKVMIELIEDDANFDFDVIFQEWQADKKFLEDILYGNKDAALCVLNDDNDDDYDTVESCPKVEELE